MLPVEDNQVNQTLVRRLLKKRGYTFSMARNGKRPGSPGAVYLLTFS
jgi:CheY-like chemotaxis protein